MRKLILIPMLLLCAGAALGQKSREDVEKLPGYFAFGDIEKFSDGDEMVEVDLMQPLLGLFSGILEGEEPEMASLIHNLDLVNVRMFSYDRSNEEALGEHMETIADKLRKEKWDNIVRARGRDEHINIFVKLSNATRGQRATDDTAVEGLAILVMENREAVFVNVVGHFGMKDIAQLGRHFDLPHMRNFDREEWQTEDDEDDDRGGR